MSANTQATQTKPESCTARVHQHYHSRMSDLRALWYAYQHPFEPCEECEGTGKQPKLPKYDCEFCVNGTYPEDAQLYEYGLSFDYVAPGTFNGQRRGYWRYQLSYSGPSDEFRFYADENHQLTRLEYWFLDWFDGAKVRVAPHSQNGQLLAELWEWFRDSGSVQTEYDKAMGDK